jgi:hypothetical protein
MSNSPLPWSVKDNTILDALGRTILMGHNPQDLDLVVNQQQQIKDLQDQIVTARNELETTIAGLNEALE